MMTQKQVLFCEAYLANGFNAKDAYREAFKKENKKPSYCYTLLKNPEVQEYIETRRKDIYDSLNIDAMSIMEELHYLAFLDREKAENYSTKLKALELLSKNLQLQTQKIETKGVIEVSLVEDDDDE